MRLLVNKAYAELRQELFKQIDESIENADLV